jgi:MobA/VirD2-like, nuclease domain
MIVRILSRGKSFSGLAAYLTHDADRANTSERVAWTHTLNLASADVPCAVNEMYLTAENAELLKQEAGIRAGGRATENAVKHLSLNWAPDQQPTREHMIETSEDFLRHMNWQEHQAILVAHQDKHPHVHVMINMVHPETGLRLDDNFERRRAQAWALDYERENGGIYCEQRLKNPEERDRAMPRNIWEAFRDSEREFANSEKIRRENDRIIVDEVKNRKNSEWEILKENQRTERMEFFNSGKSEFNELRNSIYRDVREEFRERWADYYTARKDGADPDTLAALKAGLVADQKSVLEERRDAACLELRSTRDERYRDLLGGQKEIRAELRWRQELGLDNAAFLNEAGTPDPAGDIGAGFRNTANEVTRSPGGGEYETTAEIAAEPADAEPAAPRGRGSDDVGLRIGFSVGSLFDALFFDLTTLGSAPKPRERVGSDAFQAAAEETVKREQREREEADEETRHKQRSPQ